MFFASHIELCKSYLSMGIELDLTRVGVLSGKYDKGMGFEDYVKK